MHNRKMILIILSVTAGIAVPEWYRYEFNSIATILFGFLIWAQLLACLGIGIMIYRIGTSMDADKINVNPGKGIDATQDFLRSFENEDGPTHYFYSRIRKTMFISVLFISIGTMIPMIKNENYVELFVVVLTSALTITGGVAALDAFREAILKLKRDIDIV